MGHYRQHTFCGETKTVSPAYIDYRTEDGIVSKNWGQVVDNGDLKIIHGEGEDVNIYDLKDKMFNVSDINSYQQYFFQTFKIKKENNEFF